MNVGIGWPWSWAAKVPSLTMLDKYLGQIG